MSKGLIDNPQHPRLNHFGKGYCSVSFGRKRLTETLERFEKWNEILEFSKTHYLEPTQNDRLQLDRLLLMSRAYFELGDKDLLIGASNQIKEKINKAEELKKKKKDEARQKAEKEKKNKEETDKIVKEAGKTSDNQLKYLRPAFDEINICLELLDGQKLNEDRAKKIKRKKVLSQCFTLNMETLISPRNYPRNQSMKIKTVLFLLQFASMFWKKPVTSQRPLQNFLS
ncbi:MAG: hypothetical protein GWP42_08735 [Verrucomicrobiales bacterium]|nr:hypothetical protein [Verrucomicrobiales bacterium]